jgi:lysozyme
MILDFEDVWLTYYNDGGLDENGNPLGNCTVGAGHKLHDGPCTAEEENTVITREQAAEYLRMDLATAEQAVKENVSVDLTQNEYDALVSLAFNIGKGAFGSSDVVEQLNKENYALVPHLFGQWGTEHGQPSAGLIRRRDYEAHLFKTGEYLKDYDSYNIAQAEAYILRIPTIHWRVNINYEDWSSLLWKHSVKDFFTKTYRKGRQVK